MRLVASLGGGQAVLPPHPRPSVSFLRALGFSGDDAGVLRRARNEAPELLRRASSASAMWTANAATVAPSPDTTDGKLHLTTANLSTMPHRALEAATTARVLARIFSNDRYFAVHPPLPPSPPFSDEGAANHTRLTTRRATVHLFGWGHPGLRSGDVEAAGPRPQRYVARQGQEASRAVARSNHLPDEAVLLWQQSAHGIDAGAFHTDVLCVGQGPVLLLHEHAFFAQSALVNELRRRLGDELVVCEASNRELPVADAVSTYPFNSELVETRDGTLLLVAPCESEQTEAARRFLAKVVDQTPIARVHFIDVNGSMDNGGGPACLRLRVPMTPTEEEALGARVLYDEKLHETLCGWVMRHYRDRLTLDDLADPQLSVEVETALDELTNILELGSVYDFQG